MSVMHLSNRRTTRGALLIAAASALVTATAHSQPIDVQRLSNRILTANLPMLGQRQVVAVSAKRGLALIDSGPSPLVMMKLKEEIERQFGRRDWAYVINTHGHIDGHVNGNSVFARIPVIGHENVAAEVQARLDAVASQRVRYCQDQVRELQKRIDGGAEDAAVLRDQIAVWRSIEDQTARRDIMAPNMTFTDELTIDMDDLTLSLLYFGKGHSASDVVVYISEEKVLVAGGACRPFLPTVAEGVGLADLKRSIAVLDRVLEGGVQRVVTSHEGVLGKQDVQKQRDYYQDLLAGVAAARDCALTLEKAQAELVLDEHFPYMRDVKAHHGSRDDVHAANIAAVWKLVGLR
jgi:cyclase